MIGHRDLYNRLKDHLIPHIFYDLIYAPILYPSTTESIFQKIFFRACKLNIPEVYSLLSSHLTLPSDIQDGIAIGLEYSSQECVLKLLPLVTEIPLFWLLESIKKGYVEVVKAIIQHSSFHIEDIMTLLPLYLYREECDENYKKILEILKGIPILGEKEIFRFFYC